MKPTNFIHAARAKKQAEVIRSLEQTFTDFAYPVYLFGSFANGNFHSYSDIDLVILVSKQQAKQAYNEASDKLAGLKTPYDILTCQSMDELDNTIQSTLHALNPPSQPAKTRKYQQGMTLIEIMIALLIGAFLLGGVIQIFVNTKQTYRMQEGLSRMQENGRFAMEFLSKDIRMAGFMGCSSSSPPNVIIDPKNPNPNPTPSTLNSGSARAVFGNDNVANNWNNSACSGSNSCIAGTDAITYFFGGSCGGNLTGNMASENANIQISNSNTCNFSQYDVVIISDCSSTDIFIATTVSGGIGIETIAHASNQNTDNKLSKAYGPDAEVYKFNSTTYFIRAGASGQPALWRLDNSTAVGGSNPVELIEGIENMQITYGVDTNTDSTPNYYISANNVSNVDWPKVVSVRITLTARTIDDNLAAQTRNYTFNGAATSDRRLQRVFNSTIAIRNRLP